MNTDPDARTVLCFGDSNTHGVDCDASGFVRLPASTRWTGVLQGILGPTWYVLEEGLGGRTTDLDYADGRPGRNGRAYLVPCLHSHEPLDAVVVMLGTNDLKVEFDRSPDGIADALDGLLALVTDPGTVANRHGGSPLTVVVSPIHVDAAASRFVELNAAAYGAAAAPKSRALAARIRRVAAARGAAFADAASVAGPGPDGVHLRTDAHRPLAELLATTITTALPA